MKKFAQRHTLFALAFAVMLSAAGAASAATSTGTMTFGGEVTYAPPPASCTISSPSVDATYVIPYGGVANYSKSTSVSVNCTSGTAFAVTAPAQMNSLNVGATTVAVALRDGSTSSNIATTPMNGTGTGAAQSIPLSLLFTAAGGGSLTTAHTGTVSGSVALTVTY
jgi:type 1 fimbria pilin